MTFLEYMFSLGEDRYPVKLSDAYNDAVRIERKRIRARVRLAAISSWSASEVYIGPQFIQLQKFVDRLLEDDDE